MRGRLTLDKVNAAINDMSAYAEANAQLITAPRKKVYIHFSYLFVSAVTYLSLVLIMISFFFEVGRKYGKFTLSRSHHLRCL